MSRPSAPAVARSAAARTTRRERRLRSTVARLRTCLDGLPALERRVLVLRSGLGPRHPRSRARVGRALELSDRRVARLERRGLRRLRGLARGGRCGGAAPPPVSPAASTTAPDVSPFAAPAAFIVPAAPRFQDRIEVKGEQQTSESDTSGLPPELAQPAAPKPARPPAAAIVKRDGGTDLTLPLIALAALLGLALAVRSTVRTLRD